MSQSDSALTSKKETSQDPWVQIRAGLNAIATIKAQFESQFLTPLFELLASKREQWEPIIKIARGIQALTPAERAAFLEVFETFLAEQLTYQDENASDLTALLARRGWPRIEHYLSVSEIDQALGFGSDSEVDDFIVGIFAANDFGILRSVTARWNNIPYLADRRRIVDDALQAHIHGMYTLSVPALLPFVDGVAEVVVTELGNIAPSTEKQGATAQKENTVKRVARLWDTGRHTPSSQIVREVVNEIAYKRFGKGADNALFFNRHGVLHGMMAEYGTPANSIRAFLLLDAYVGIHQILSAARAYQAKIGRP